MIKYSRNLLCVKTRYTSSIINRVNRLTRCSISSISWNSMWWAYSTKTKSKHVSFEMNFWDSHFSQYIFIFAACSTISCIKLIMERMTIVMQLSFMYTGSYYNMNLSSFIERIMMTSFFHWIMYWRTSICFEDLNSAFLSFRNFRSLFLSLTKVSIFETSLLFDV